MYVLHIHAALAMPKDIFWYIWFVQIIDFFGGQYLSFGLQRFIQPVYIAETADRTADAFVVQPRQCYKAHLPASLLGKFLHPGDY